ncbi:MAG TPA: hypothetical protein VN408_25680 [Actinoplanes sp.]|nr:hypothetical protein [Actinoplanes sp.]
MLMALLLDAANIVGGLLLAIPLLARFPAVTRTAARLARWQWVIGILALVAGGYYLLVHMISGPRVFHFEVVGVAVGVILAWDRLTGRTPLIPTPAAAPATSPTATGTPSTSAGDPAASHAATGTPSASVGDPAAAQGWPSAGSPPAPAAQHNPASTTAASPAAPAETASTPGAAGPAGAALVIAVFGLIAILVGIQGLFTPN